MDESLWHLTNAINQDVQELRSLEADISSLGCKSGQKYKDDPKVSEKYFASSSGESEQGPNQIQTKLAYSAGQAHERAHNYYCSPKLETYSKLPLIGNPTTFNAFAPANKGCEEPQDRQRKNLIRSGPVYKESPLVVEPFFREGESQASGKKDRNIQKGTKGIFISKKRQRKVKSIERRIPRPAKFDSKVEENYPAGLVKSDAKSEPMNLGAEGTLEVVTDGLKEMQLVGGMSDEAQAQNNLSGNNAAKWWLDLDIENPELAYHQLRKRSRRQQKRKKRLCKESRCNFNMYEVVSQLKDLAADNDLQSLTLPYFSAIQRKQVNAVASVLRLRQRNTGRDGVTFLKTKDTIPASEKQDQMLDKFCKNVVTHGKATQELKDLMGTVQSEARPAKNSQTTQDNESSQQEINLQTRIDESNKGNQMLRALGWQEGQGIGAQQQGIHDPLPIVKRRRNKGLGY